ncbi:MAG: phosphoribosylformylglycinamidine synthase subunit PurS [Armatimonadota bacterium]
MRVDVELRVRLKVPDVTALTARNALQRRLGHGEALVDLERADYWRLGLEAQDEEAALELATELAEKTNLFVNPNKHTYRVRPLGSTAGGQASSGPPFRINVLVTSPEDPEGAAACAALRGRLGYGDRVVEVACGVLWTLTVNAGSLSEAERLAREMAITERIDRGLLVNPHYQDVAVSPA